MNPIKKTFQYGQHTVTIETGEIARQATGAVFVTMDDTVVFVTVVGEKEAAPGRDFFPMTIDYMEKTYPCFPKDSKTKYRLLPRWYQ